MSVVILMYIVILITCPDSKTAEKLADLLLDKRLGACTNIIPNITSHYWWKSKKYRSKETLMVIKTKSGLLKELVRTVRKNHPYENPEIIALPIIGGSKKYTEWIEEVTKITE